jgi:hypothetical protein
MQCAGVFGQGACLMVEDPVCIESKKADEVALVGMVNQAGF